jgi:DedD protein
MDQSLKQRLIGVTIAVALVVIFAPMLFDETEQKPGAGMPSLPADVLEKPLDLPKSAEELAPKEEERESAHESGYRIIPLTDEPPKPQSPPATAPVAEEEARGLESGEEADAEEPEDATPAPGIERKPAASATPRKTPAKPAPPLPAVADTPGKARQQSPAKPTEPTAIEAKKPKRAPSAASKPVEAPKLVKPVEENPPAAAEAKPAPVPAKPKAKAYTPSTKKNAPVEKAPAAEAEPAVEPAPVKPSGIKPATVKPAQAKPVEPKPAPKPVQATKPVAPPPASKPVAAPQQSAATGGTASSWTVQTGSFTSEAKARELTEKLQKSHFPAYMETVNGAKRTTYRVRVGPEPDRARAEQLQKQIQNDIGIQGYLVPRP